MPAQIELELPDSWRAPFESWVEATLLRHSPPLTPREIQRGVRALSALYVERRREGRIAARSVDGAGKRAALACYYAPLHFMATYSALEHIGSRLSPVSNVLDLGCGTGGAGAAAALWMRAHSISGTDRSGWALREARATYKHFSLRCRTHRTEMPSGLPPAARAGLTVCAWSINELDAGDRTGVLEWLRQRLRLGEPVLILEPLAMSAAPWWPEWCDALGPLGVEDGIVKRHVARPPFVCQMDRSAGLDHRILGVRWLAGPLTPPVIG